MTVRSDGAVRAKRTNGNRRARRPAELAPYVDQELVDHRHAKQLVAAGEGLTSSRPVTISVGRIAKVALRVLRDAYPEADRVHEGRPRSREECEGGARPCPFVSCKHNVYLSVSDNGNLKLQQGALQPWEVKESCSLDVADRGPQTLEAVGEIMNLTRERMRQEEDRIIAKLKRALRLRGYYALDDIMSDFVAQTPQDHRDAEPVGARARSRGPRARR